MAFLDAACRDQCLITVPVECIRMLIHTSNSSSSSSEAVSISICLVSLGALGAGAGVCFALRFSGSGVTAAVPRAFNDSHHLSGGGLSAPRS